MRSAARWGARYTCAGSIPPADPGGNPLTIRNVPPRRAGLANAPAETQTALVLVASPVGEAPMAYLRTLWSRAGSMRAIVPSYWSPTQTNLADAAIEVGPSPTGMVSPTWPVLRSMRVTLSARELATQTASGVTAIPEAPASA